MDRFCQECGTPLFRGRRESQKRFENRKYCSLSCAKKNNWTRFQKLQEPSPKACAFCSSLFYRKENEQMSHFKKRKHCCGKCYRVWLKYHPPKNKLKRTEPPPKICLACSKLFTRGKKEKLSVFLLRKYCSTTCFSKKRKDYFGHSKWTTEEDELLKALYPSLGKWGTQKMMPSRSLSAIKYRANHLKVSMLPEKLKKRIRNTKSQWIKEEDDILREFYEKAGPDNLTILLPHKSIRSIKDRARLLGIKINKDCLLNIRSEAGKLGQIRYRNRDWEEYYVPGEEERQIRLELMREKKKREGDFFNYFKDDTVKEYKNGSYLH